MKVLDAIVIGGGISGLTAAYELKNQGKNIALFEKESTSGGALSSYVYNDCLFEKGANTAIDNQPEIGRLVESLGISNRMIFAERSSSKRYILFNKQLNAISPSPKSLLSSKLFSLRGKIRLLKEPFVRSQQIENESLGHLVERRFGKEFLTNAFAPMIRGIYASDPKELHADFAMPILKNLEAEAGSILKGFIREKKLQKGKKKEFTREIFSFKNGIGELPLTIQEKLGEDFNGGSEVISIEKESDIWLVCVKKNGEELKFYSNQLILAIPAYTIAKLLPISKEEQQTLKSLEYPSISILHTAFPADKVNVELDAFGFLAVKGELPTVMGSIWNNCIFPERVPKEMEAFTIFVTANGRREPLNEKEIEQALEEFKGVMKIEGKELFCKEVFWKNAFPKYGLNYGKVVEVLNKIEEENYKLSIIGNIRDGISVGDCIKNATALAKSLK